MKIKKAHATLTLMGRYYVNNGDRGLVKGFEEVEPIDDDIKIKGLEGFKLFLHKGPLSGQYVISEAFTGLRVSHGKSIQEALEKASEKVKPDLDFEAIMKTMFNAHGLSPAVKVTVDEFVLDFEQEEKVAS